MSALPRGRCPVCGGDVALRVNGRVREHRVYLSQLEACGVIPAQPELRDPVVIDGVKYRIRSFDTGEQTGWIRVARLREHFTPHREATAIAAALTWDKVAGVWRAPE